MTALTEIILASASPRRLELLRALGLAVMVVPSGYPEPRDAAATPAELALAHAKAKATDVGRRINRGLVVAADTVVDVDGMPYGKPRDERDAARMLQKLSGRKHVVHTAFCLFVAETGACITELETTSVWFFRLSIQEIAQYVASGEPMDKAGAYGVQGVGATLVESIAGDFYTVMGFPVARFARALPRLGFSLDLANTAIAAEQ